MKSFRTYGSLLFVLLSVILFSAPVARGTGVRISVDETLPGWWSTVSISVDSLDFEISGFNIVLAVDQSTYALISIDQGQFVQDCEWEYFTYRTLRGDSLPEFDLMGNTDLLNITGVASVTEGYAPLCYGDDDDIELARLLLLTTYDSPYRVVSCMFLPVSFFWRDCNDNVLYSRYGDTVYTANTVYAPSSDDPLAMPFPGFGIPDPPCPDPPGQTAVNSLSLYNGGLDVICCDTINHWRGDLNLNGFPYEVADLVTYYGYFLWGLSFFTINVYNQIAQSDINGDSYMLTIADMIFLQRIMIHQIMPAPRSSFDEPQAYACLNSVDDRAVMNLDVNADVGAVYLRFVSDIGRVLTPSEVTFPGPVFAMGQIGDTTTMLLVDLDGKPVLYAGSHILFECSGSDLRLTKIELVDNYAVSFNVKTCHESTTPEFFSLKQNYPNPFNQSTTIEFFLKKPSDWKLTIHNMLGQQVTEFEGPGQEEVRVNWHGLDANGIAVASGVYFYRLQSEGTTETRKMLLLK
ncbi:MAG: T9SS type A sorting domain-containing protein [candidate division Zixibacteria bacterium]|nr:T9SS type A sorting domain-containing protein [candidate division Zixibacteria bacterium]